VKSLNRALDVEVLGEQRVISAVDGRFSDHFEPYAVHLYRFRGAILL
jgi:hypothetical protein